MSHELRTPLNAVIGFSDVLLERMFGELNERQEEYVRDIRDSGRHLLELINEILDLSKVEAGRMELEPAALSLPDLLEHGLAMVRERAARHGIALSLDVAAGGRRRVGRRAQAQAGRAQPAQQRGQVHARRRLGRRQRRDRRRRGAGDGARHRDRHRRRRPRADLRGLPARRPRGSQRGHRARAHALQADRRAARRADLDDERARGRQHVRLRRPRPPAGRRGPRADARGGAPPSATWRPCSWSRTIRTRPSCSPSTSRAPGTGSRSRATAPRASSWPAGCGRAPSCSTSCSRASTAGTCSRA